MEYELAAAIDAYRRDGLITEYLGTLRPGKEAIIHCCRRPPGLATPFAILKQYKDIEQRSFRHDALYGLGTSHADARTLRATTARSAYGLFAKQKLWARGEHHNLAELHALGLAVPCPLGWQDQTVLMDMLGNPEHPAQQLREVRLTTEQAVSAHDRLQQDILTMLTHDRVHGDLSAYNVLWHDGQPWIIDCPQVVDPRCYPASYDMLHRDARNLLGHFTRYGVHQDIPGWVDDIWHTWLHGG